MGCDAAPGMMDEEVGVILAGWGPGRYEQNTYKEERRSGIQPSW